MGDTTPIPAPSRGISGSANLTVLVKLGWGGRWVGRGGTGLGGRRGLGKGDDLRACYKLKKHLS